MAAMSKMARHCEEDIANKSQSARIAYSKINHFGGDVFAGGPTNKTLLLTVTDIRLESTSIHEKNGTNQKFTNTHGKSDKIRKKNFFPLFPVGGTSVYPVDKQQPRTGRTKLILAVSAFNFFFPFIVSFLSFQLNVSLPFIASFLSFRLFLSMRYFCPFVPCLRFRSLLLPIRFNSSCRFNSSFPFIVFLSFHFTFSLLCVTCVRSFQVLYPVRFLFPFVSTLPCRLLRPSF